MKFWKKIATKKIENYFLYLNINYVYLIWIFLIYLIFFAGNLNFLSSLKNWDSGHFLGIANSGYLEKFQYAFFPLYPLTIRVVSFFTGNSLISATLISILSTFFGLIYLKRLIALEALKVNSGKVALYLLLFPTSFYFFIPYSEGLFFFFSVATFYFAKLASKSGEKVQLNLFLACIFAALSSATRITGIAVIIGLIIQMYIAGNIKKNNWFVILAPFGIVLYCVFLYFKLNNPFYFLVAEEHWQRSLSLPVVSLWESLIYVASHNFDNFSLRIVIDTLFAVFGIGFSIRSFRFLPAYYSFFILVSLLIPLSTSTLTSFPRFILPVFPIFFLLAKIKHRLFTVLYIFISVIFLIYFEFNFINGNFG